MFQFKKSYGRQVTVILLLLLFFPSLIFSSRNTSRYFPFLEKPEDYVTDGKKSNLTPSLFLTTASTAFKRGGGTIGIPELWGEYDLKDVIFSLKQIKRGYDDPTETERKTTDWIGKSVKFKVDGKIKSRGLTLGYKQDLNFAGLSVGAFLPVAHINASSRFYFDNEGSDVSIKNLKPGEEGQIDRIRSQVHKDLGIKGMDWSETGIGDLDLFVGWNRNWDHKLLVRSINLNLRGGVLFPTGIKSEIDYPISVPFANNGHWGTYFDAVPEFELKQDLRFGLMFGFMHLFNKTNKRRIPVYKEPAIFSPLKADVQVNPGMTFKFSPYLTFENLRDGLHLQCRYTYLRHSEDSWKDKRSDKTIKSYLERESLGLSGYYKDYDTTEKITENIESKKGQTKWRAHYITLELIYDTKEAFNNWIFDPKFYFVYDSPISGSAYCKTHQFTVGVELHF